MPVLKRPVFERDLTPLQRNAARALEKAAAKLRKLNKTSLQNLAHLFEDVGTFDDEVETEQMCRTILEHLIEEKGL